MLMYVLLVVLSISVSDSLKCPVCEFQLTLDGSLPDKSTLPESCEIRDEDAGLCKALMVIDHSKDYVYVLWTAVSEGNVTDLGNLLDIPLPLEAGINSLTKFQFDVELYPQWKFDVAAVIVCQSNDYCIIDETNKRLSNFQLLKCRSFSMMNQFQALLSVNSSSDDSSPDSTISCHQSNFNKILQCPDDSSAACFVGKRHHSSGIIAECTSDSERLFVSVSFYLIDLPSKNYHERSLSTFQCNRDQCNRNEVYDRVIGLAKGYLGVPERRPHRKHSRITF